MEIRNKTVEIQIYTGASCNVVPRSFLLAGAETQRTKRELVTYSTSKLSLLGTAIVPVRNAQSNVDYAEEFVEEEDEFTPLLGAEAVRKMILVEVEHQNILHREASKGFALTEVHNINSLIG